MGSSIRPGKSLNAKVEIASPLNINKVEIIKDGTIVKIIQPGEKYILWEVNIINNNSSKATFLYAKASLSNENFVWSSPIWVGAN